MSKALKNKVKLNGLNTADTLGGNPSTTSGVNENVLLGGNGTFSTTINASRPSWDALGPDPVVSTHDLELDGTQMSDSVNSAVVLGGRVGYYSSIGPTASLSLTYNADNINNHLAGINLGYHTDLLRLPSLAGEENPKGSHGVICGGSYQQVSGDYSGSFAGTVKQVFALQSVALGGKNIKVGSETDVDAVRRSGVVGGLTLHMTSALESFMGGGQRNTLSGDRAAIIGGEDITVSGGMNGSFVSRLSEVTAVRAVTIGSTYAKADVQNAITRSVGRNTTLGDSQTHHVEARRTSVGPNVFVSVTGGSGIDLYTPESNTTGVATFEVVIQENQTASSNMAAYVISFAYSNIGGTLAIKGQNLITLFEDNAAFNCIATTAGTGTRLALQLVAPNTNTYVATATGRIVVNRIV